METNIASERKVSDLPKHESQKGKVSLLLLIALCIDLFTPLLIWKGILPASIRWISYAAILILIVGCVFQMLLTDYIPRVFLLMMAFSVLWGFVAIAQGQDILTTFWGWWLFFQFPFVGLYLYIQPKLPEKISRYFRKAVVLLLCLEVAVQIIQYLTGEAPGDNLAGFFGKNGTGNLVLILILTNCMFFGFWITSKKWGSLFLVLCLSAISSVLGEMKLYPVAILSIGLLAILIYAIKNNALIKMLQYLVLLIFIVVSFFFLYNNLIGKQHGTTLQQFFTNPQTISKYLNVSSGGYREGSYYTNIRRNDAINIAWTSLQTDPIKLLFGWGLGARSESKSLGTVGTVLASSGLGLAVGTGLLQMMQELGIVGLMVITVFFMWVILKLIKDIRNFPNSHASEFRYGLLLFTVLWPVWLWYNTAWTSRAPMLFYWMVLGYVMAESRQQVAKTLLRDRKEED